MGAIEVLKIELKEMEKWKMATGSGEEAAEENVNLSC
jgi:hypothetical protein